MSKKYLVPIFFFMLILNGQGYGNETKKATTNYSTIVKQLKDNIANVDFQALRYSYTKTTDYNPYKSNNDEKDAMFKTFNNSDFEKALKHAHTVIEKNYTDLEAHFVCMIAFREMKNTERQNFHSSIVKGLLDSIYASGDGKSPETAFVVINTDEEYFLLNINGYKVIKSSLVRIKDHSYDRMDLEKRKTGEKAVFFFNIDMPFNWLSSKLGRQ